MKHEDCEKLLWIANKRLNELAMKQQRILILLEEQEFKSVLLKKIQGIILGD